MESSMVFISMKTEAFRSKSSNLILEVRSLRARLTRVHIISVL